MTTVLADVENGLLLADSFQEHNQTLRITSSRKLVRLSDGSFAAWSGDHQNGLLWVEWMEAGGKPTDRPGGLDSFTLLHLKTNGKLDRYDSRCIAHVINEPLYAIGNGSDWAMCAMYCGRSALDAMRVACKFSPYTCGPIVMVSLKVAEIVTCM